MARGRHRSKSSDQRTLTQFDGDEDCRSLFNATIADINFRHSADSAPVTIDKEHTVNKLLVDGPASIVGKHDQQLRWIHLPANNMAWVEDLFDRLQAERDAQRYKQDGDETTGTKFAGVLRDSQWRGVCRGNQTPNIHDRFIVPLAARYSSSISDDPESDESDPKWSEANVIAIFLPYLQWEGYNSWKHRQRHIARMKELRHESSVTECDCRFEYCELLDKHIKGREALLLHQTLFHSSPLHDRRTLDQSYFYNLRNVARKDEDQVIGQHTWDPMDPSMKRRKMMMADQLWMWVIDYKTIVTAFPTTYALGIKGGDITDAIFEELPGAVKQGSIRTPRGLMAFIIDRCTGVFHRNDIPAELTFFQHFADEIGEAKNELESMLHEFHELSGGIESLWIEEGITVEHMSSQLDILFSIKREIKLISRIDKIVSDLDKVDFLCSQQEDAVRDLLRCCKPSRSITDLSETLKSRRNAWAGMSDSVKETRASLQSLLDLKQRQATVGEARSVRYQIELSAKQGRSIMLLTVFTVLFLPISVMAAIFGMNASELVGKEGGKIRLGTITAIVFPTTITLVLAALAWAFTEQCNDVKITLWRAMRRKVGEWNRSKGSRESTSGSSSSSSTLRV